MFYKINKPKGISSFFAIKKFAKENNIKKIGHAGTLDPLAEGLLIVATNDDTKTLSYLLNDTKEYYVEATLNWSSASFDEGEKVNILWNKPKINKEELLKVIKYIKNTKTQIPPVFSAKKINGRRSYELARDNKEVILKECNIKIYYIELIEFNYETQRFCFKTKVSKGTYIRSLVHDIGLYLNSDAVVNVLKRTSIGNIKLDFDGFYKKIVNLNELFNVQLYTLNSEDMKLIQQKELYLDSFKNINNKGLFIYNEQIIGWGKINNGLITFKKILGNRVFCNLKKGENNEQ
ncbi:tRNA pseudouridine(55) synthase TruB [Metamycoplasma phocicerebrale]|uniref:tRNA pseudouridine synthase B n=1 Tax=Metamycoplasma phocicerebrale TaxID=142649 RepID=A0A3T0TTW8_9BACT|nr:tRNA pseudouridine(55) synthase TruB [Metamycoplasma phocicerebrale]AZZ65551.1 tRNA pseudouridine(55) synthase TruB [Metamycoplasma phocicerebrale]